MATGFGLHNSSTYGSGFGSKGRSYAQGYITQSVDTTARTVTITLRVYLAYYRSGENWSSPYGELGHRHGSPNWISGNLDGKTGDSGSNELGLYTVSNKSLLNGRFYNADGVSATDNDGAHVSSYNASRLSSAISKTYNYSSDGSAITVSWSGRVVYNGTTMDVGGTVTTDAITPLDDAKLYVPLNGRAKQVKKLYCSVGGQAKKIKKLYASVNDEAKLIYKDNS